MLLLLLFDDGVGELVESLSEGSVSALVESLSDEFRVVVIIDIADIVRLAVASSLLPQAARRFFMAARASCSAAAAIAVRDITKERDC